MTETWKSEDGKTVITVLQQNGGRFKLEICPTDRNPLVVEGLQDQHAVRRRIINQSAFDGKVYQRVSL